MLTSIHGYGKYPKYPVADAGYGSYNNYIYCEEHGIESVILEFTLPVIPQIIDKKAHQYHTEDRMFYSGLNYKGG